MFIPGDKVTSRQTLTQGLVLETQGHKVKVLWESGHNWESETDLRRTFVPKPKPEAKPLKSHPWELLEGARKALSKMSIEWRGHFKNGSLWGQGWGMPLKEVQKNLFSTFGCSEEENLSLESMHQILKAQKTREPLKDPVQFSVREGRFSCPYCETQDFETDGLTIRPLTECPFPNGMVTEFTLNVPSGKILVDDDLRYLCRIPSRGDVNTVLGTQKAILNYADSGLALGFGIGNSSPTVAKQKGARYTIGHRQGGRKVAHVCTDLWAYSIMDAEEAKRRAEYYNADLREHTLVNVQPGLYRFRHYHKVAQNQPRVLFAEFERVGDAQPVEDWTAKMRGFAVHITQAVQHRALQRNLTGLSWEDQCQYVFLQEFAGAIPDRDWHENGHRNNYLPKEIQDLPIREIPHFRSTGHWDLDSCAIETCVSRQDPLFGGDIPFNDSYAVAAGRVLESTISFGLITRLDYRTNEWNTAHVRQMMFRAANLWYGLIERYPHVAKENSEFAAWMEDRDAVQAWIEHFDLSNTKESYN